MLACRQPDGDGECSWVYWGGPGGFSVARRTRLPSQRRCDVAMDDLDGDGRDEIILCQHHDAESYTTHSLVYRVGPDRQISVAAHPVTHDARRILVARPDHSGKPQLVFVNVASRTRLGSLPVNVYLGGPTASRRAPSGHHRVGGPLMRFTAIWTMTDARTSSSPTRPKTPCGTTLALLST